MPEAIEVLRELCRDVESIEQSDPGAVIDEWPDIWATYVKARIVCDQEATK